MSLTTHVLDTASGLPGAGITVELFTAPAPGTAPVPVHAPAPVEPAWTRLAGTTTDPDGRARLTPAQEVTPAGVYRLRFHTRGFYPWVDVTVATPAVAHLHVPLLLSPFGYTTYRGS